jgi:1-acyl-sn-glycerol-3-phosphate acyltransferase
MCFNAAGLIWTGLLGVAFLPILAGGPQAVTWLIRLWAHGMLRLVRWICGVRIELRGFERIPPGAAVIASKHQSAFDTIVWLTLLPEVTYVLKQELLSIPLYGWYARRSGMIPVDREGGGQALRGMLRAAQAALAKGRQIVIFPEGTRTSPGERVPYLPGVVAIAGASDAPVFPVATDSGRLWPPRSIVPRAGLVRIAVLPPLPPRLPRTALLHALETAIETETALLFQERDGTGCG